MSLTKIIKVSTVGLVVAAGSAIGLVTAAVAGASQSATAGTAATDTFSTSSAAAPVVQSAPPDAASVTESRPAFGPYPGDVDGDGVVSDTGAERIPELVETMASNGVLGYSRVGDLSKDAPASPEIALAQQAERERQRALGNPPKLTVYARDGVTVVGYLIQESHVVDLSRPGLQR
ncbi:MAG: hypothetical protein EPO13_10750 [Actinomycetota bacterium]|nr:MAG: hypothetical protein EPO13_10750 [Actinomycetota bacterium]